MIESCMIALENQLKFLVKRLLFCLTFNSNNTIIGVVLFEGAAPWWRHESWPTEEFQRGVKWHWGCCCHPAAANVAVASAITVDCHLLPGPLLLLIIVWVASAHLAAAAKADCHLLLLLLFCCKQLLLCFHHNC